MQLQIVFQNSIGGALEEAQKSERLHIVHCNIAHCTLQKMYPPTGAFNESGRLEQPYFGSNLDLHSLVSSALEDAELVSDPDLRSPFSEEGFNSPPILLISCLRMRHWGPNFSLSSLSFITG